MEIITLKDAARITKLSYTYMFENKSKYGFARQDGKGRWLVDKKLFEEKFNSNNNNDRLTSDQGGKKCRSRNVVTSGILISKRQMDQELDALLEQPTKEKR
jgi:hypothetical protein